MSGAGKVPWSTPLKVWSACSWQPLGQCSSTTDQLIALGGRSPSWVSVPLPTKSIGSPTFHMKPVVGETIVAVGGVSPAVMPTKSVAVAPCQSVTRRPAL